MTLVVQKAHHPRHRSAVRQNQHPLLTHNFPEFLSLQIRFGEMWMFTESYETYQVHRKKWMEDHWGEYVAISVYDVAGFFPTFAQAFDAGRRRYGLGVFFLTLRIHESDQLIAAA